MRRLTIASVALLAACSGGRPLVLVEVSLGEPGIMVTGVDISATPASGSGTVRHFDWNSADGSVLSAGLYLADGTEGSVSVRASGSDPTGAVEATGTVMVQKGKATAPLPLALRRVGSPLPDGGTAPDGAPPVDAEVPRDGAAPDLPPPGDQAAPVETAAPVDAAPVDPPSLTRCQVFEHAGPCELKPTTAGVGVWDLRFSPDGKYLVSGGDDGKARIWKVAEAGLVDEGRVLDTGNAQSGVHIGFSVDGTRLALGTGLGMVNLYEFPKAISVEQLSHPTGVSRLIFTNDGKRLVTLDWASTVRLWDLATSKELRSYTLPEEYFDAALSAAGQPDSLWLVADFNNKPGFVLLNLAKDPVEVVRVTAAASFSGMALSPDGNKLALGSEDGAMTLWDVSDKQKPVMGPMLWPPGAVNTMAAFSPDGRFVTASGSRGMFTPGEIKIATVQPPGLRSSTATVSSSMSIDFSPDGRAVAAGSWRCGKITYCKD